MRQIKFQGRTNDGRYVTGDLYHEAKLVMIVNPRNREVVDPKSVRQLVYREPNEIIDRHTEIEGLEYYEGDIIERDGRKWRGKITVKWEEIK